VAARVLEVVGGQSDNKQSKGELARLVPPEKEALRSRAQTPRHSGALTPSLGTEGQHLDLMHGVLREEVQRRKDSIAAAKLLKAEGRRGPCQLARSAAKADSASPASQRRAGPESPEGDSEKESLWEEVFMKLRDDNELHRHQLPNALEMVGVPKPNQEWIDDVYAFITSFNTLGKDEFLSFVKEYEVRQRHAYAEAFTRWDIDGSGLLEPVELAALMQSFGIEPMKHVLDEVVATVDCDGHGTLDFSEFEAVMTLIQRQEGFTKRECEVFRDVFHRFDHDKSGSVDTQELAGILRWLGFHVDHQQLDEVVEEVDVDGSGSISEQEFVLCMRKVREREIQRVKAVMLENDADGSGSVSAEELGNIFEALGYEPDQVVIDDMARELGLPTEGGELDFGQLWQLLAAFRSREGFSDEDMKDISDAYTRYDTDRKGEVSTLEVGKILHWLGYVVPLEVQQEIIDKVDVDNTGCLDICELRKLIRMYNDNCLRTVRQAFVDICGSPAGAITLKEAGEVLRNEAGIDYKGKFPPVLKHDLKIEADFVGISLAGLVATCNRLWKAARQRLQANCGFDDEQVLEFRALFVSFDKDASGDIGKSELKMLIEQAFPDLAHDKKMRPKLMQVLREVDSDGSGTLDFGDFLQVMQRIRERRDQEKLTKELTAIKETGFLQNEVKEFRELFRSNCAVGEFRMPKNEVVRLLCKACDFQMKQLTEFSDIFHEVVERHTNPQDSEVPDNCDFPEFLWLMQKLLEIDFAGIKSNHRGSQG